MTEKLTCFRSPNPVSRNKSPENGIAASIMLWCATPQQAAADTYENTNSLRTTAESENDRYGSGPEREKP